MRYKGSDLPVIGTCAKLRMRNDSTDYSSVGGLFQWHHEFGQKFSKNEKRNYMFEAYSHDLRHDLPTTPLSFSLLPGLRAQAVFFHVPQTPIRLLTVPARPTIPSSRFAYPSAELGIVRSQTSDINWRFVVARSLQLCISIECVSDEQNLPLYFLALYHSFSVPYINLLLPLP